MSTQEFLGFETRLALFLRVVLWVADHAKILMFAYSLEKHWKSASLLHFFKVLKINFGPSGSLWPHGKCVWTNLGSNLTSNKLLKIKKYDISYRNGVDFALVKCKNGRLYN